jgi:hypothetical protein
MVRRLGWDDDADAMKPQGQQSKWGGLWDITNHQVIGGLVVAAVVAIVTWLFLSDDTEVEDPTAGGTPSSTSTPASTSTSTSPGPTGPTTPPPTAPPPAPARVTAADEVRWDSSGTWWWWDETVQMNGRDYTRALMNCGSPDMPAECSFVSANYVVHGAPGARSALFAYRLAWTLG